VVFEHVCTSGAPQSIPHCGQLQLIVTIDNPVFASLVGARHYVNRGRNLALCALDDTRTEDEEVFQALFHICGR
jgi:hypothetical protein